MHLSHMIIPAAFVLSANALFDCNDNQHAFDPASGKFVVHFTPKQNSHYNGNEPWIRICLPNSSGGWDNVDPLGIPCSTAGEKVFGTGDTKLKQDLSVGLGSSCSSDGTMSGTYLQYGSVIVNLAADYSNGEVCGKNWNGISCQFDL